MSRGLVSRLLQDFVVKLKSHLLPRVRNMHCGLDPEDVLSQPPSDSDDFLSTLNQVIFKGGRMYRHTLFRINYTTYDLRRESDTVNPSTDRRDIMMLAHESGPNHHPFCYARVLGVFHANVIFIGPGSKDYLSRRLEFLWVRWLQIPELPATVGWDQHILDKGKFLPMNSGDAFGFVDPADVLRGCHLLPSFADGRLRPDRIAASRSAHDADDWNYYYINRYLPLFFYFNILTISAH